MIWLDWSSSRVEKQEFRVQKFESTQSQEYTSRDKNICIHPHWYFNKRDCLEELNRIYWDTEFTSAIWPHWPMIADWITAMVSALSLVVWESQSNDKNRFFAHSRKQEDEWNLMFGLNVDHCPVGILSCVQVLTIYKFPTWGEVKEFGGSSSSLLYPLCVCTSATSSKTALGHDVTTTTLDNRYSVLRF